MCDKHFKLALDGFILLDVELNNRGQQYMLVQYDLNNIHLTSSEQYLKFRNSILACA